MQLGNIDTSTIDFAEHGLDIDAPRASKTPAEFSKAQETFERVKHNFDQAAKSPKLDDKVVAKLIDDLNELSEAFDIELRFSVKKEGPDHINVKIVNIKTNEVVRELPTPRFSRMGSKLIDKVGLIIDKTA